MTSFFLLGPSYFFSVFEDTFILFSYFCLAIKDLEDSGVLSGLKKKIFSRPFCILRPFVSVAKMRQLWCGFDSFLFMHTEETFCYAGRKI